MRNGVRRTGHERLELIAILARRTERVVECASLAMCLQFASDHSLQTRRVLQRDDIACALRHRGSNAGFIDLVARYQDRQGGVILFTHRHHLGGVGAIRPDEGNQHVRFDMA
jgi:hypothetical protein